MKNYFISFVVMSCFSFVTASAQSLNELDLAFAKERVRRNYGELSIKPAGDWRVSYQGKETTWKWSEKSGWTCPADSSVPCADWVPTSFKWWGAGRGWLENWSPVERAGFDFGSPKVEGAAPPNLNPGTNPSNANGDGGSAGEHEDPAGVATPEILNNSKWALEVWQWRNKKDQTAKVGVSLKDHQRIEKIDADGTIEYLGWQDRAGKPAELSRLVLEKNGIRVAFSRSK